MLKRVFAAAILMAAPSAFAAKVNCYGATAQGQFIQVLNVESEDESRMIVSSGRYNNPAEIRVLSDTDLGLKKSWSKDAQVSYTAQLNTPQGKAEVVVVITREGGTPDEFSGKLEYPGATVDLKCSEKKGAPGSL